MQPRSAQLNVKKVSAYPPSAFRRWSKPPPSRLTVLPSVALPRTVPPSPVRSPTQSGSRSRRRRHPTGRAGHLPTRKITGITRASCPTLPRPCPIPHRSRSTSVPRRGRRPRRRRMSSPISICPTSIRCWALRPTCTPRRAPIRSRLTFSAPSSYTSPRPAS